MSLYKRNGKWYYDFTVGGKRFNKSTGLADKQLAAEAQATAMTRAMEEAKRGPRGTMTLSQAILRGNKERWGHRKDGYQTVSRLERICSILGDCTLDQLDRARIDNIRDWLERTGATDATVNRYLAALKTLLNMAHREWDVLESVPSIKLRPERPEHRRALTEAELKKIEGFLLDTGRAETADLVVFLADTGMRLSEALGLTYRDVYEGCAHLTETKAGRPRVVPLTERAFDVLGRRWTANKQPPSDERIFQLRKWAHARAFKDAVLRSGVDPKGVCLHALRHTCCTNLVTRGAGLAAAGAVLGHSTATMTTRYAHLDVAALRKAVDLLEVH